MDEDTKLLKLKVKELEGQVRTLNMIAKVLISLINNERIKASLKEWLRR